MLPASYFLFVYQTSKTSGMTSLRKEDNNLNMIEQTGHRSKFERVMYSLETVESK
jgi:hypothetical protein